MSQISEEHEQQFDMASLATSDANAKGRQLQAQRGLDGFTPGPWSVMWQNSRAREYAGGWKSWETPVQVGARENAGNVLCTVTMGGPGAGQSDQATVEANARLIASAPDLLAAVVAMVRLADMGFEDSLREPEEGGNFAAYNLAVAAIARATGAS